MIYNFLIKHVVFDVMSIRQATKVDLMNNVVSLYLEAYTPRVHFVIFVNVCRPVANMYSLYYILHAHVCVRVHVSIDTI
jgi:hypothetical protein